LAISCLWSAELYLSISSSAAASLMHCFIRLMYMYVLLHCTWWEADKIHQDQLLCTLHVPQRSSLPVDNPIVSWSMEHSSSINAGFMDQASTSPSRGSNLVFGRDDI
jgi:hypothetical protein